MMLYSIFCYVIKRSFHFQKTLMNARPAHTTVTLMPTAPIPKDHSIVPAIRDTPEMESSVLVIIERFSYYMSKRISFTIGL